jgi:hypothetical protein
MKKSHEGSRKTKQRDAFTFYRLLQLNLHGALVDCFKLRQEFENLREKSEGGYIFGKQFVGESGIGMVEILEKIFFHLNAISDGGDMDLFIRLDRLKAALYKCFDKDRYENENGREKHELPGDDDEVLVILKRIMSYTSELRLPESSMQEINTEDCISAHDFLLYCCKRICGLLSGQLEAIKAEDLGIRNAIENIVEIPINWLDSDREPGIGPPVINRRQREDLNQNSGAKQLIGGINEVMESNRRNPESGGSPIGGPYRGLIIHSPNTITFYYLSPHFEIVLTSNICDAPAGNYIYLLVMPAKGLRPDSACNLLMEKLLHWLDFVSFKSRDTLICSIKDMTLNQLEDHLNTAGKLFSFVSSPGISLKDDSAVQKNVELFLETIV